MYEVYQKYITQENFDPSLVPVSSIISLAKVAQRLIDGAEDIIFPANFFIGSPTATCNLTANGSATIKNTTILGDATINGNNTATTDIISDYLNVGTIISTVSNLLTISNSPTTITGDLIVDTITLKGLTTIEGDLNSPSSTITFTKDVTVLDITTGNLTTSNLNIKNTSNFNNTLDIKNSLVVNNSFTVNGPGTFTYKKDTPYNSADGITREYFKAKSDTLFGSKAGWNFVNSANNTLAATIDSSGKLSCNSFTTPNASVHIKYYNKPSDITNNSTLFTAVMNKLLIKAEQASQATIGCNNLNFVNSAHSGGDTNVKINGNLNITDIVVSASESKNIIPTGMIIMWNKAANTIPEGWILCDGTAVPDGTDLRKYMATTPDIKNRIIGIGTLGNGSYNAGSWYDVYDGANLFHDTQSPARYTLSFIIKT